MNKTCGNEKMARFHPLSCTSRNLRPGQQSFSREDIFRAENIILFYVL